ncbi:MAG: ParB/RepB/Spo0J family partition protein [Intestinimonas sp.]
MAKKNLNDRCPLQEECERKCEHKFRELECDYYANNGIGEDRTIPDQEEKRREIERRRDEEQYEADLAGIEDDSEGQPEKSTITYISVKELHPHPDNPRKDVGDVSELAESIKANGVLQNLTVVPNTVTGEITGDTWQRGYKVIIGHRRLAAAKLAGLEELPCVVVEMSEREQLSTMLTENMQRSDLTVYEQAQGFQMMLDMGDTVEDIAEKSGFSTTTVRRR